ncbi:hypothetical protein F7725_002428 [Dissostichus mawsoni]|uniref:Translin n=1 Tax=Dissostichus mawsoni TaxID=36200 RepID=A0A7J5Y458_DISMA|nr:hypothetical protein F7725_002428 [Dissostichus mawsoni]
MSVTEMFSHIQGFLSADQDIREDIRKVVQMLEQTAREILTVLQSVHQPFHEHWRFVLQRLVFLATFVVYLETEALVIGRKWLRSSAVVREKGFHLDVEDYLAGSRLAVNSVTSGDYTRPLRISNFINELDSGFQRPLRKRYDGLKYDVKKIEEVVYDLSIRGLTKEARPPEETSREAEPHPACKARPRDL